MKKYLLWSLFLGFFCLTGCDSSSNTTTNTGKLKVATTFYPLTEFTKRIGGEEIEVFCYLPEGEDAIFWKPTSEILQKYQQADLIIINGAEFEKWVNTASLPTRKVVNTSLSFKKQWVKFANATTHSHGDEGEHSHEGIDGHTWVSPVFAKIQAEEIQKALSKARPEKKEFFEKNFQALASELDGFDQAFKQLAQKAQGKTLAASHPAYNYLSVSYGFVIKSFDFDPEEIPEEKQIEPLLKLVKEKQLKYLIWESFPAPEVEKFFKEKANLNAVEFSPVENLELTAQSAGKTYFSIFKENLAHLEKVLE